MEVIEQKTQLKVQPENDSEIEIEESSESEQIEEALQSED
jgi:hypothetical protein